MIRLPWSEEESELLTKLWNESELTVDEIAKAFKNRTTHSIRGKAQTLGLGSAFHRSIYTPKIDYEYLRKLGVVVEG